MYIRKYVKELYMVSYYDDLPTILMQVFHVCHHDGRQDSFLCPNGTVFNQKYFVCDWWYNFNCEDAPFFYPVNAALGHPGVPLHVNQFERERHLYAGSPTIVHHEIALSSINPHNIRTPGISEARRKRQHNSLGSTVRDARGITNQHKSNSISSLRQNKFRKPYGQFANYRPRYGSPSIPSRYAVLPHPRQRYMPSPRRHQVISNRQEPIITSPILSRPPHPSDRSLSRQSAVASRIRTDKPPFIYGINSPQDVSPTHFLPTPLPISEVQKHA